MRIYTIHTRPTSAAPDQDAISVKEGFAWLALFFPLFWALWFRLWAQVAILIVLIVVIGLAASFTALDPVIIGAIEAAVAVTFGLFGNDWRRRNLAARGYIEAGIVAGRDRATAEHRYFCMIDDGTAA